MLATFANLRDNYPTRDDDDDDDGDDEPIKLMFARSYSYKQSRA